MGGETGKLTKNKKISKLLEIANGSYLGRIVEIDDPEKLGRVRINVYGVFGDEKGQIKAIPKDSLPWAYPLHDLSFGKKGAAKYSSPRLDAIVRVVFDGDQYHPRYYSVEDLDPDLQSAISADPKNFNSLMFDTEEKIKMYYSQKSGMLIDYDTSIINIKPDNSILIDHKNSTSTIEMKGAVITIKSNDAVDITTNNTITHNSNLVHVNGAETQLGANPIWSAVSGEPLMILLKALGTALDAKLPLTPGVNSGLVAAAEATILSKTVTTTP